MPKYAPFVYGTPRLGGDKIPFEERVKAAQAARQAHPLPEAICDGIVRLQVRWSDETGIQAEPWSM